MASLRDGLTLKVALLLDGFTLRAKSRPEPGLHGVMYISYIYIYIYVYVLSQGMAAETMHGIYIGLGTVRRPPDLQAVQGMLACASTIITMHYCN